MEVRATVRVTCTAEYHRQWKLDNPNGGHAAAERRAMLDMALSEDQTRLLWLYHDFLRSAGLVVCERVARPDGSLAHRPVLGRRGKELIEGFADWRERQERQEGPSRAAE